MTLKPCDETAACHNVLGSYRCSCPEKFEGDGRKNGTDCRRKLVGPRSPIQVVILGW